MSMRAKLRVIALAGLALGACGDDSAPPMMTLPEILNVQATTPITQGTALRVSTANLDAAGSTPRLRVAPSGTTPFVLDAVTPIDGGIVSFRVSSELVSILGEGRHDVDVTLFGALAESEPYPFVLDIEFEIPIALTRVPDGNVHRNEEAIIEGDGFLEVAEGTVLARFEGTFTPEGGAATSVNIALPVLPAEDGNRERGVVVLSTAIGGSRPGEFEGTISLESTVAYTGTITTSGTLSTNLFFQPPVIFEVTPEEITLEQLVRVRGAGFLGGDETTILRASGTLTPAGGSGFPVGPAELILGFRSGAELVGPITSVVADDILVSELFGIREGRFEGTVIPITLSGGTEVMGDAAPITLVLTGVKQVIWVRFLPGFYDSLARFGLSAATGTLEPMVEARIEGIYGSWNVDVRLERPDDYSESHGYSTVEIGGPDPNGRGLFGYDNTPGKDVGNVRLFDSIGGENAETQMDGFPGYGGVFVESLFGFSEHPPEDLAGTGGPDPDPLFDEIFDPVRNRAATLAEVRGEGERRTTVMRAVMALSSIIGETTAHEIGHSLGLASPYGSRTTFHNAGNEPGCLMDSGSNRPLGERANEPGFTATHICGDGPEYLDEILGR